MDIPEDVRAAAVAARRLANAQDPNDLLSELGIYLHNVSNPQAEHPFPQADNMRRALERFVARCEASGLEPVATLKELFRLS